MNIILKTQKSNNTNKNVENVKIKIEIENCGLRTENRA